MPKKKAAKPAEPVGFTHMIKKLFGSHGEKFLGTGKAKRSADAVKKRKKRMDDAIRKQGG